MDISILAYVAKHGHGWELQYSDDHPVKCFNDMQRKWAKIADQDGCIIYLTRYQMRDYMTLLRSSGASYYRNENLNEVYYSGVPVRIRK